MLPFCQGEPGLQVRLPLWGDRGLEPLPLLKESIEHLCDCPFGAIEDWNSQKSQRYHYRERCDCPFGAIEDWNNKRDFVSIGQVDVRLPLWGDRGLEHWPFPGRACPLGAIAPLGRSRIGTPEDMHKVKNP